jgi:hypothetical protein
VNISILVMRSLMSSYFIDANEEGCDDEKMAGRRFEPKPESMKLCCSLALALTRTKNHVHACLQPLDG